MIAAATWAFETTPVGSAAVCRIVISSVVISLSFPAPFLAGHPSQRDEWGLLPRLPWRGNRKNLVRPLDLFGGIAARRVPLGRKVLTWLSKVAGLPPD